MTEEIRTLLARHLPGHKVRRVAALGEGLDNAAFEVDGELVVRKSKEAAPALRADAIRREAHLLAAVARISTLPVPEPAFADPEAGFIAYRRLPGRPLMDHPVSEPALLAPELGRFLGRLHGASLAKLEGLVERDCYPLAAWLEDAERDYGWISGRLLAGKSKVSSATLRRRNRRRRRSATTTWGPSTSWSTRGGTPSRVSSTGPMRP